MIHTAAMLLLIVNGLAVIFGAPTSTSPPPSIIASEQVRLPKGLDINAQQKNLAAFWTPEKMKQAKPFSELYPDRYNKQQGNTSSRGKSIISENHPEQIFKATLSSMSRLAYPGSLPKIGKVFWNVGNGYYSYCSAAIITSDSRDMIVTAGHCIHDGTNFFTNNQWAFMPGYRNGVAPYGIWPARRMIALLTWTQGRNYNADVGMVALSTVSGLHIQDYLGSNGIIFNARIIGYTPGLTGTPPTIQSFGYPLNLANGQTLQYCSTTATRSTYTQNSYIGFIIRCDMTGGCSGGPWMNSANQVFSVNSFMATPPAYSNLNGPYFDQYILSLYDQSRKL